MSSPVPDDAATLGELRGQVHLARLRAQRKANTELLQLWWRIGRTILDRHPVTDDRSPLLRRIATELRAEFPSMRGFSRRNLTHMRAFARAWPDMDRMLRRPVAQLPWDHVTALLDALDDQRLRDWYAAKDLQEGWSRSTLTHHIATRLHEREKPAPYCFFPAPDRAGSDQDDELAVDPYTRQFLAIDGDAWEREREQRLLDRMLAAMRALDPGYALVGRQVHLIVGATDYYIDLLFFHITQQRYVVVEARTTPFLPADAGLLGFYVTAVDDQLRDPDRHQPTVGILVAGMGTTVVRYALASTSRAVAVTRADLPADAQRALPDEAELARIFAADGGFAPPLPPAVSARRGG